MVNFIFKAGDKVRVDIKAYNKLNIWPNKCLDMNKWLNTELTIKSTVSEYVHSTNKAYYVYENDFCWNDLWLIPADSKVVSNWTTYLDNKGYIKKEVTMLFTTNPGESVAQKEQLKKYDVRCSETHYFSYIVEAHNPVEAERLARSGDYDQSNSDYDNFSIDDIVLIEE